MKERLTLFKLVLASSFPIAGIVHYLMPITIWLKNQDLLTSFLALSTYYCGFFIGNQYVIKSKTSLSRIVGMMFTAHVITTLIFAAYGYDVFLFASSLMVGITTGGLLSLPSYMVLRPFVASITSLIPLISAFIIFTHGVDEVLLTSSILALVFSILQLLSLKVIVMKPRLIEKTDLPLTSEALLLSLGIGICGSVLNVHSQLVAIVIFNIEAIHVGSVIAISLLAVQTIGWGISKQNKVQRGLGTFIMLSLFFSILFMTAVFDAFLFLFLWTLALIDLSVYNSFIGIVNRSLKKFDDYKFTTLTSIFSIIGPTISLGLWTLIGYKSVFYIACLLVLISWLGLRRTLRDVKE